MRLKFVFFLFSLLTTQNLAGEKNFKIKFYATNWGMAESWDSYCSKVKNAGYDGLETWLPGSHEEQVEMNNALKKYGLSLGLLAGGGGGSFEKYYESFVDNIWDAANMNPDYINCHTGKEYYTFGQNRKLIEAAEKINQKTGIPIYHETHRGRFSFAAHITEYFLKKLPQLVLTLDISHWCNVHESLLADQNEAVTLALERTGHVHVRVGHPQGPQVGDPSAPEWQKVLEQHLLWWDEVVRLHKERGSEQLTMTMEFGPPDYLPTIPHTQRPVADQWQINLYMLDLLKRRYQQW